MKRAGLALSLISLFALPVLADSSPDCWRSLMHTEAFVEAANHLHICDQENTPYCSLYAMKTFLESWSLFQALHSGRLFERDSPKPWSAIDPAFLALSYNLEIGSGSEGHTERALTLVLQKNGVLPAVRDALVSPLRRQWTESWSQSHLDRLWNAQDAAMVLSNERSPNGDSAIEYLRRDIQLEEFRWFRRKFEKSIYQDPEEIPAVYRHGTRKATLAALKAEAPSKFKNTKISQRFLVTLLLHQLKGGFPVFGTINAVPNTEALATTSFLSVQESPRTDVAPHAVVFLTFCTAATIDTVFCRPFAREIQTYGDCVLIQNSWGESAHRRGRICVRTAALTGLARSALIHNNFIY